MEYNGDHQVYRNNMTDVTNNKIWIDNKFLVWNLLEDEFWKSSFCARSSLQKLSCLNRTSRQKRSCTYFPSHSHVLRLIPKGCSWSSLRALIQEALHVSPNIRSLHESNQFPYNWWQDLSSMQSVRCFVQLTFISSSTEAFMQRLKRARNIWQGTSWPQSQLIYLCPILSTKAWVKISWHRKVQTGNVSPSTSSLMQCVLTSWDTLLHLVNAPQFFWRFSQSSTAETNRVYVNNKTSKTFIEWYIFFFLMFVFRN